MSGTTKSGELIEEPRLRNKTLVFEDRSHAGTVLAEKLKDYAGTNAVILAIPAGGVPVAAVLAKRLQVPFDVLVVSKIHIPWNREAGFGALSWDGTILFNEPLLALLELTQEEIAQCIAAEQEEIERRLKLFRGDAPFPDVAGKSAIIVDDGIASGFTMLVALASLRTKGPKELIVAVPTASLSVIQTIRKEADMIVCLNIREGRTFAVADAYRKWYDLRNEDVVAILKESRFYDTH